MIDGVRRTVRRERGSSVKEGMKRAMLQAKTSDVDAVLCESSRPSCNDSINNPTRHFLVFSGSLYSAANRDRCDWMREYHQLDMASRDEDRRNTSTVRSKG